MLKRKIGLIAIHRSLYGALFAACLLPFTSRIAGGATTTDVFGGSYSGWATTWTSLGLDDGFDAGVVPANDIVGNASHPALAYAQDSSFIYFRLQLATPSLLTSENASYMIYLDVVGVGSAHTPDFGFGWDAKSDNNLTHGLEMNVLSSSGPNWGDLRMTDVDGSASSKGTMDINGNSRTGDGYLRIITGADGFGGTGANSYIECAVSWDYLENRSTTILGQGQTWNIAAGTINAATDHGSINANGDVAGGINYNSTTTPGWSTSITTVPEVPASPLLIGGVLGAMTLIGQRRRRAGRFRWRAPA